MMPGIRVPGTVVTAPPEPDLGELRRHGAKADNVQAVEVGARRAGEPARELYVRPDSIVELTLESGAKFYHRYDQLAADLPANRTRSVTEPDLLDLPLLYAGPVTRSGAAATVIESVRTFDLDLSPLGDFAGRLAGKPLAEKFDSWRADQFGLRTWSIKTGALGPRPVKAGDLAGSDPLLLFIHGTGSSTQGGFGAIPGPEPGSGPSRADILKRLQDRYSDRVVAFDHPTLSVSPIDNAIALLSALPAGAHLHLVTHSRGGMVGELLCWPDRADGTVPFAAEIDKIRLRADRAQVDYTEQLAKLAELGRLLQQQRPVVDRFVRVACPAAGTTLASGRLDRWLSLTTSVLDLTGLGGSQVYQFLKGFLLAVVKTRTDPRSVPGLEAMMPGSLLTMLLNRPGLEAKADLSVIAGDIEGGSWLARLGVAAADWFYGADHDLVVDTVSMYGGLTRTNKARFFFDKGEGVSHFNYFRNEKTLGKMVDGLLRSAGDEAGFQIIERTEEISEFLSRPRAAGPRPVVFLVPDFMGSHLAANGRRVWIDLAGLAQDGLDKLRLDGGAPVEAEALVADAYAPLVKHLLDTYDVVPFPYDWRLSVSDNGGRFAGALRARLAANASDPVRIIAHGSGGLIALASLAADVDLRRQFVGRSGARLLLLDPPLHGSVRVARLALGLDRLTQYLALLAMQLDGAEVTAIFRSFPGVIDLLPTEVLDQTLWQGLGTANPSRAPADALLAGARRWQEQIKSLDLLGLPLLQVNGIPAQPVRMAVENGNVRFFADGPLTKAATTAAMVGRTWWAQAESGELASLEPLFEVYTELLASGTTIRLPQEAPSSAASAEAVELPADALRMFPDEQELAAAALGYVRRRAAPARRKTVIRLVHGNLAFARWPVGIGHYENDSLTGAEAQLDRALNGRLSRRRDLRVYPGRVGTAEIVLDSSQSPKGALVIGLGTVGTLTPGSLNRTVSRALRRYAVAVRESRVLPAGQMGISLVLIGTGEGGLKMLDAIASLLEALKYANAMLGDDAFTDVEFIELSLDRAIAAAHVLLRFEVGRPGAYQDFVFDGFVGTKNGGHDRSAPLEDPGWWRRLKIESHDDGALQFTDLTDRARLPERPVASQAKVAAFVNRAVTEKLRASEYSASGTLYELLLPADFKRETGDDRGRILVLDATTASYPWELLRRPGHGDEKPLSVRAGMVRQLTQAETPDRPVVTTGNMALVVGNPPTGLDAFPLLPGAGKEAKLVRDLLKRHKFSADEDRIERTDGSDSMPAILCGRWRIMHLAGHGAVDFRLGGRTMTGMALENGSFFGPEDVKQMEAIPELVFLNCCYLGAIDATAERKASARFHELAANVASSFIKFGARAVVAAGWAVDDDAAQRFAEVFYDKLLNRGSFGEATLAARRAVYAGFGHTNTWGAYQCYGDPAYQLTFDGEGAGTGDRERVYVHLQELITEIRDIVQDAQTLATRDRQPLRERLSAIAGGPFLAKWSKNSELQAALGRACADLGMIDEAIAAYTRALEAERADAPIRVIEQLANLRTRRAVRASADKSPEQDIRAAIKLVMGLPKLADGDYTSERWSLLGSCNKRLAQVAAGAKRSKALEEMYRCYGRAFQRAQAAGSFDTYSLLNRLTAEALLRLFEVPHKSDGGDPEKQLMDAENEARRLDNENPDFWNGVALADIALGRALLQGRLDGGVQQDVIAAYLRPWRRGGSALQFASVLEQVDFLIAILNNETGDKAALCDGLRAIRAQLTAATGVT